MLKAIFIPKTICSILTVIIIASFVGFCVENVWIFFRYGFMDNRGMYAPFLLGYGLACIMLYLCFGLPDNPRLLWYSVSERSNSEIIYFLLVFFAVIVGESLLGYVVEYFTGIRWWDYSSIPLHIGRYTSIPTSIGFALGGYIFIDKIFPVMYNIGGRIYNSGLADAVVLVAAILVLDNIHALLYMHRHNKTFCKWKYVRTSHREGKNVLILK